MFWCYLGHNFQKGPRISSVLPAWEQTSNIPSLLSRGAEHQQLQLTSVALWALQHSTPQSGRSVSGWARASLLSLHKGVNKCFLGPLVLAESAHHVQLIMAKNNVTWNIWVPFMGCSICKGAFSLWGPSLLPWQKWICLFNTWGRSK